MDRTIKFRAWDKEAKKMLPSFSIEHLINNYNSEYAKSREDITDFNYYTEKDEELILMQFTGLLDKNGKEIYEGDIVGGGRSGIIMFYDGAFNGHYYGSAGDIQESWEEPLRYNNKDCEVIGNIYENPELLK